MSFVGDGGSVERCDLSSNGSGGIRVDGDLVLVSSNRVCGHSSSSGVPVAGIDVDGTGCHVRDNFVCGNDIGVALRSGQNVLYENSGSGNSNPLFEGAAASTDAAPSSSASSATSAFSNIGFQP
jgi:hypothetical protein